MVVNPPSTIYALLVKWLTHLTFYQTFKGSSPLQGTKNVIAYYKSISEAARKTGGHNEHIGDVCRGKRKTANGYLWECI